MDPVSDLSFFVLLARLGNLSAAAQQLGVTPPTVSKRLAALERRLGVRLLHRTTRRVSLSAEGEAYLGEGSRLLGELQVLEQTIAGSRATPRGLLRVHGTLGFGRRHLAPALSAFAREHAEVEVQLTLGDRPVNLVEQGLDVAVTLGGLPDARLTARRLASNHRLLCASPRYLRQAGEPARPAELAGHQCIVLRESDETFGTWHLRQGRRRSRCAGAWPPTMGTWPCSGRWRATASCCVRHGTPRPTCARGGCGPCWPAGACPRRT